MSKHPAATREDHDTFRVKEGWQLVRGASGQPVKHRTYKLLVGGGRVLCTRISRPVDRTDHPKGMWSKILREQLKVSADEFWACVHDGANPRRSEPSTPRPGLPYYLLRELTDRVGMDAAEAVALEEAEAEQRIADYWADQAR